MNSLEDARRVSARPARLGPAHGRLVRACLAPVLLAVLGCAGTGTHESARDGDSDVRTIAVDAAPEIPAIDFPALGIEELQLRRTNHGYLIDFRYRVVDESLARPMLDRKTPIRLVDPNTGGHYRVIGSPKVGPLRNTGMPVEGRTYYVLFANPGGAVAGGTELIIEIGDHRIEGIPLVEAGPAHDRGPQQGTAVGSVPHGHANSFSH